MDSTTILQQVEAQRCELSPWQLLQLCPDIKMALVKTMVQRAASADASVVIRGETGTGKQIVAEAIHQLSRRNDFVIVDCANLDPNLVRSDLYGHERGSFTGADRQRLGAFEIAKGGTIMLDEIGELSLPLQASLLHVLERKCFRRVGSNAWLHTDARVIAATNRNLREMVKTHAFRADLFFRLNVLDIDVPVLSQRPADVIPLAKMFVDRFSPSDSITILAPESEKWLREQSWPGNIRELRNVVERAMVMANGAGVIQPYHLDPGLPVPESPAGEATESSPEISPVNRVIAQIIVITDRIPLVELIAKAQKAFIARKLQEGLTNQEVANRLGVSVRTLRTKRHELQLPIGRQGLNRRPKALLQAL